MLETFLTRSMHDKETVVYYRNVKRLCIPFLFLGLRDDLSKTKSPRSSYKMLI